MANGHAGTLPHHVRGDWTDDGWRPADDGIECQADGERWPCEAVLLSEALRESVTHIRWTAALAAVPEPALNVERLILELGDLKAFAGPNGTAAVYESDVIRTLRASVRLSDPSNG